MIEIKIAGNTAAEALADLTKLADLVRSGMMQPVGQQKSEPVSDSDTPDKAVSEPAAEADKGADVSEQAAEPVAEDNTPEKPTDSSADTAEPARTYTREEVRAETVAMAKKHGKQAVRDLLESLGAQGVSTLPPEKYPEFMQKLGEINAEYARITGAVQRVPLEPLHEKCPFGGRPAGYRQRLCHRGHAGSPTG